jgi:hypothetical protein
MINKRMLSLIASNSHTIRAPYGFDSAQPTGDTMYDALAKSKAE